jgi:uncharacterized protein
MKKIQKNRGGLSRRLHFPEDEARLPWLPLLLDAYAIADTGVAVAIRDQEKKFKRKLACKQGCDVCCRQTDIPLYPHELVGLYWFASEKLAPEIREAVKQQLAAHAAGSPCPFLVEGACSVHPARPVACRKFNVFTAPCAPREDPYYSRRHDVLIPIAEYTDRAFAAVLALYNLKPEDDPSRSVKTIRSQIMNLQSYDWKKLAVIIEQPFRGPV